MTSANVEWWTDYAVRLRRAERDRDFHARVAARLLLDGEPDAALQIAHVFKRAQDTVDLIVAEAQPKMEHTS